MNHRIIGWYGIRGIEIVIGGLLLFTGVGEPLHSTSGELGEGVSGAAQFRVAEYNGPASVNASDAALLVEGSFEVLVTARSVSVSLHEYQQTTVGIDTPVIATETGVMSPHETERRTYENPTIRVLGETDGLFQAWPNAKRGIANMSIDLKPSKDSQIFASEYTEMLSSNDGMYWYMLDAPLFALGHRGSTHADVNVSQGEFDVFQATGDLELVVEAAKVIVEHTGGRDMFQAPPRGSYNIDGGLASVGSNDNSGYIIVNLQGGEMSLGFHDERGLFLSRKPTWHVNGTLAFEADGGRIEYGETNRTLEGDEIQIAGNTTLNLGAAGDHDGSQYIMNITTPGLFPSQSTIDSTISSDSDQLSINGQLLDVGRTQTAPEQVTLPIKILGAILLVWGLLKNFLGHFIGLLVRNPLDHPRRELVYSYLTEHRLAHCRSIHRATGIPMGSLIYHLRVLRESGLVTTVCQSGYRVYFLINQENKRTDLKHLALLANATRHRIATTLSVGGPLTQRDLGHRLDLSVSTVSDQLNRLVEAGLVQRVGIRNGKYKVTRMLQDWMRKG